MSTLNPDPKFYTEDDLQDFRSLDTEDLVATSPKTVIKKGWSVKIRDQRVTGEVFKGRVLGFQKEADRGRTLIFKTRPRFYASLDLVTDGDQIISADA